MDPGVFTVKDCALLAIATGRRIHTLNELRDSLSVVAEDSIYYHFWGSLLQPRFEEREYNNDFASWVRHGLHDARLAERLAVVDPREFPRMAVLRQELLELVEERLDEAEYLNWVRSVQPFEFMRAQTVVFTTDKQARDPRQLVKLMPTLTVSSIFYHFIDARRRVPEAGDDFSAWLSNFGAVGERLRRQMTLVDPYFLPLTALREQLSAVCAHVLGNDDAA